MKLFVLEDDACAMKIVDYLKKQGHRVYHVTNILDTAYCFEEDPGLDFFDLLLFDAVVPKESWGFMGKEEKEYGNKYGFTGLEFIVENYEVLKQKPIALLTAFKVNLVEAIKNDNYYNFIFNKLTVIDKSSDDFVRQISSFLRRT